MDKNLAAVPNMDKQSSVIIDIDPPLLQIEEFYSTTKMMRQSTGSRLQLKFRLVKDRINMKIFKINALKYISLSIAYTQLVLQIMLLSLLPMMHVHDRVAGMGKLARNIRIEEIVKISIQYGLMLLTTAFTVILIIGIHKGRSSYIKAFLMYSGIVFFLSILMSFGVFLYLTRVNEFDVGCRYMFSKVLFFLFHLYCLLMIRCYQKQLIEYKRRKEEDDLSVESA